MIDIFESILTGYCSISGDLFRSLDYNYFAHYIALIPFELGLRFFTDYLKGNIYFKTQYANQNLLRAEVQFKIYSSIISQKDLISDIIYRLSNH